MTDLENEWQRDQNPHFLTSALDEEDVRDPAESSSGTLGGENTRRDEGKFTDQLPT